MITCSILSYLWDMWSSRVLFYLCMYLSLVTHVLTVGIFHCSRLFSSKITPISLVIFFWFPERGHLLDHHVPLRRPSAVEIPLPQMLSRFFPPLKAPGLSSAKCFQAEHFEGEGSKDFTGCVGIQQWKQLFLTYTENLHLCFITECRMYPLAGDPKCLE